MSDSENISPRRARTGPKPKSRDQRHTVEATGYLTRELHERWSAAVPSTQKKSSVIRELITEYIEAMEQNPADPDATRKAAAVVARKN